MRPRRDAVTARTVAEHAGVSTATVSLVLNGKSAGRVSSAIEDRVRAAAAELRYVANSSARSLSSGTSSIVALIAPNAPIVRRVHAGVHEILKDRFTVIQATRDHGPEIPRLLRDLVELRPAGMLLDAPGARFVAELDVDFPVVLLGPAEEMGARENGAPWSCIDSDIDGGARLLVRHLVERGHKRVVYVDADPETSAFRRRRESLLDEARIAGITIEVVAGVQVDEQESAMLAAASDGRAWLSAGYTAIIAVTDMVAYGVIQGLDQLNIRVPQDVALAGFDDMPTSAVISPPLTSVTLEARAIGEEGARMLLRLLDGGPHEEALVPVKVVPRRSTELPAA